MDILLFEDFKLLLEEKEIVYYINVDYYKQFDNGRKKKPFLHKVLAFIVGRNRTEKRNNKLFYGVTQREKVISIVLKLEMISQKITHQ